MLLAVGCAKKPASTDRPAGLPPSGAAAPGTTPPSPAPSPNSPPPAGGSEAENVPAAPEPSQTIAGTIVLPAARRGDVKKGDTIFLIARKTGGPAGFGSMLAVQRLQAGDFPMPFALSSRDAMVPGTPFEGEINISVRVDKDGDPITRRKGDVFGQAAAVRVGRQDVRISLDNLQAEDVTLNGGMPPGHP
jgi:hypothetical protein